MSKSYRVLVADPDPGTANRLRELFRKHDYRFTAVTDGATAAEAVQERDFDAVICEFRMEGKGGLGLLQELRRGHPQLPVLVTTGQYDSRTAIEVVKAGAFDFLAKPLEGSEIFKALGEAVNCSRTMIEPVEIDPLAQRGESEGRGGSDALVGNSRAMLGVYKCLGRLSPTPVTVLIRGETGTGKELVARALYQHGHRAHRPFITVNCAAIPENLLESELFGHEKGAFTGAVRTRIGKFEQANGATLFLDEIGDLDLALQAKLLRVLQEKQFQRVGGSEEISVDVRIIAATHQDLESMIERGRFREDLFYRLNVASLSLPPLREREGDIPVLIDFFLRRSAEEFGLPPVAITAGAIELLDRAPLPGNVRQLQNLIRKATLNARGFSIDEALMRQTLESESSPQRVGGDSAALIDLCRAELEGSKGTAHEQVIQQVERILFREAMERSDGNLTRAASALGLSRLTLREKLKSYGMR